MTTDAEFKIEFSDRLKSLPPYLFVEIDRARRAAIAAGRDIINLGVGDPDQRETGDPIASPAQIEHLEMHQPEKQRGHVVAEAILAREEIEKFAHQTAAALLALALAEFARLAEDLFVRDRPRDAGNGQRQQKQERELVKDSEGEQTGCKL